MKNKIGMAFIVALVASTGMAQNTSKTKAVADDSVSSRGFRVSFLKPTLDTKMTGKFMGQTAEGTSKPDSALGIAIGYASLPVQELGYTTNLALIEAKSGSSANIARIDGNLGYAFNPYVNLKGGLNAMKFTSGNGLKDLDAGFGYQASLGFQLNKNAGIDIGYSELNTSGRVPVTLMSTGEEIGKAKIDYKMTGLEIGLNATF
jgi:hypothetical protein